MAIDIQLKSYKNDSGFKLKMMLFTLIANLLVCGSTIAFIYVTGNFIEIKHHIYILIVLIFIGQIAIFLKIARNENRSKFVGHLFQNYIEKSHDTTEEFEYPKKNIQRSFDQQFDLVNKTAAAIAQITQMISRTNEQINDCKAIIETTEKRVLEGNTVMEKLNSSIAVIKSATEDMDQMVQVINQISLKSAVIADIVAKTELLAMNASIESARAGEYGKGFSVVSEEVESLARTSGKSAKQIKDLLNESSMKVGQMIRSMNERIKEGEMICKVAFEAFDRIKTGVEELKEQIEIINSGTDMQKGVIQSASDILAQVANSIQVNNKTLNNSNESILNLISTNQHLFELSEELQCIISGPMAAMLLQRNRNNEVRRVLEQIGY